MSDIDFGDYVEIEIHRYGVPNEFRLHKVISAEKSSWYATVPIQQGITGTGTEHIKHENPEDVLRVTCDEFGEMKIFKVRKSDVRKVEGVQIFRLRDQVEIINSNKETIATGTIVNINDFREPGMEYAIQIEGLDDFVFVGKSELKLKERK